MTCDTDLDSPRQPTGRQQLTPIRSSTPRRREADHRSQLDQRGLPPLPPQHGGHTYNAGTHELHASTHVLHARMHVLHAGMHVIHARTSAPTHILVIIQLSVV